MGPHSRIPKITERWRTACICISFQRDPVVVCVECAFVCVFVLRVFLCCVCFGVCLCVFVHTLAAFKHTQTQTSNTKTHTPSPAYDSKLATKTFEESDSLLEGMK